MSSHLTGAHRRSSDHNSRERHSRSREVTSQGAGADVNGNAAGHSRPRNQGSEANQVKEAIIDLYLKIKMRQRDEVSACLIDEDRIADKFFGQ